MDEIPIKLDDLHSVQDMAKLHPNVLTMRALRWQLRHRDENGLAPACVKVGKKLLISGARYEHWLTKRAGA